MDLVTWPHIAAKDTGKCCLWVVPWSSKMEEKENWSFGIANHLHHCWLNVERMNIQFLHDQSWNNIRVGGLCFRTLENICDTKILDTD